MNRDQREIRRKLRILEHADRNGSVSRVKTTVRIVGLRHTITYIVWSIIACVGPV